MNRHSRKALAAQHKKFLSTLQTEPERIASEVRDKFMRDLKARGGKIDIMYGAFGPESNWSDAYIEAVLKPDSGGTFVKLYGCPYLVKGLYGKNVEAIQFPKHVFSEIPRDLIRLPFMTVGLAFTWLFHRRGFLRFLSNLMDAIELKVLRHYDIPEKEHNAMPNELYRALVHASQNEGAWTGIITKGASFLRLFLESDNTYRFRIQDALPLAVAPTNRRNRKPAIIFLRILEDRETSTGIGWKWRFIRTIVRLALLTSPALRRISDRFFRAIDRRVIKLDEADWYFALDFTSYNFGGISYEERHKLREQANKEKGVVALI